MVGCREEKTAAAAGIDFMISRRETAAASRADEHLFFDDWMVQLLLCGMGENAAVEIISSDKREVEVFIK